MITFKKLNLNRSYYPFSDIKNVDLNILSINKIYTRNTDVFIYSIKYIMMESINNQNIDSEIPLCLTLSDIDAYINEESGNKYLIIALTENNKKLLELYKKLWSKIKDQNKAINSYESVKYRKNPMKIKLNTNDHDLPLVKILAFLL